MKKILFLSFCIFIFLFLLQVGISPTPVLAQAPGLGSSQQASPGLGSSQASLDIVQSTIRGANPLVGVPEYDWWYGCSPTAGGMMIGYWDTQAGYENLVDGVVSTQNQTAKDMVASQDHIDDYWIAYENTDSDPMAAGYGPGGHPDDCIADFMHTSRSPAPDGGTAWNMIAPGLQEYANWDNPDTAVNEAYDFTANTHAHSNYGGAFDWDYFCNEIDNDRPMELGVMTVVDYEKDPVTDWLILDHEYHAIPIWAGNVLQFYFFSPYLSEIIE